MSGQPRRPSRAILDGPERAPARAYLRGIGYDEDALQRPIVGIANTWTETMPCNFHLRRLAERVKDGVRAAGGTPMEFNTVAISDGITMGTAGMKTSLVSRELVADSIELVARGHMFDAVIAMSGCDKTIPGCVMALARLDVPSLMLYGGSILPGRFRGKDVTIQDVFEAVGAHAAGSMSDEDLHELEGVASPGAGACGGQFTANTMATAFEVLGISPMGSGMVPAEDGKKGQVAEDCGRLVMELLEKDLRPSAVITSDALENAIACVAATGGSTNAVLHLMAIANEIGRAALDRRLRPHQLEDAAARRPEAERPLRGRRPLPRGRHAARDAKRLKDAGPPARGRAHRQRQDDRRGGRRWSRRPTARRSCARSTPRSARPAASPSCTATWRPTAAWSS